MTYLTAEELEKIGFKSLGKNVKISDKASIYDADMIEIGNNSRIDDFCIVSGKVEFGDYCHITPMCLIAGGQEGVFFSDFCTLAYGVKIFSQSDDYSGETMANSLIPEKYKNEYKERVCLERHVIIGAGSIIMPGITLTEGCSVGAMSIVTKSTEPWGVYVGIPAKRIKNRKQDLLKLERKFLEEAKNDSF